MSKKMNKLKINDETPSIHDSSRQSFSGLSRFVQGCSGNSLFPEENDRNASLAKKHFQAIESGLSLSVKLK